MQKQLLDNQCKNCEILVVKLYKVSILISKNSLLSFKNKLLCKKCKQFYDKNLKLPNIKIIKDYQNAEKFSALSNQIAILTKKV